MTRDRARVPGQRSAGHSESDSWLASADQARARAAKLINPEVRNVLIHTANLYERLARQAAADERLQQSMKDVQARVESGARHIRKQEKLIADMRRMIHQDLGSADDLLQSLKDSQQSHIDHRDRLRHEIAGSAARVKARVATAKRGGGAKQKSRKGHEMAALEIDLRPL